MLENSFRIALDPLFPPPLFSHQHRQPSSDWSNKYSLIYDQHLDFPAIRPFLLSFDPDVVGDIIESDTPDEDRT